MASDSSLGLVMAIMAEAINFGPSLRYRDFTSAPITIAAVIGTGSAFKVLVDRLGCC